MTPDIINRVVIDAAAKLLPAYDSQPARAMLIAIAMQESGLRERRQIARYDRSAPVYGPARSWWMFERIGVQGVMEHAVSRADAAEVLRVLDYMPDAAAVHQAMEHNDIMACCFARLLLRTLPQALPGPDDMAEGWRQYTAAWRPGKPRDDSWPAFWAQAWEEVL